MNIGVAKVFQIGAKLRKLLMVVLVQPRLSITFISSKEGWCGESHTLPYSGYATDKGYLGTRDFCPSLFSIQRFALFRGFNYTESIVWDKKSLSLFFFFYCVLNTRRHLSDAPLHVLVWDTCGMCQLCMNDAW